MPQTTNCEAIIHKEEQYLPDGRVSLRAWGGYLDAISPDTCARLFALAKCLGCGERLSSSNATSCNGQSRKHENTTDEWLGCFTRDEWSELQPLLLLEYKRMMTQRGKEMRSMSMKYSPGTYGKNDLARIYKLQMGECYYCEQPIEVHRYHVDHMMPVSRGGSEWPSNIALACSRCNLQKSALDAKEYLRKIGKKRGKEWLAAHEVRAAEQQRVKGEMDVTRRRALGRKVSSIAVKIRAIIPQGNSFSIEVDEDGLQLHYEGMMVLLPPESHRKVPAFTNEECRQMAIALQRLGTSFGY